MPPTVDFQFPTSSCLICRKDCLCDNNIGDKEMNSNQNEIIARGQSALRTLRWSKTRLIVSNDETILNEEKCRPIITLKDVAEHDTQNDCWIILYDRVYDVTSFLYEVNILNQIM